MTKKEDKIDGRHNNPGRPEKKIDWDKVDRLLMAGCKGTEIAPHFDMHVNTFYDRVLEKYNVNFTDYCSIKREQGESLLREKQFEKALKGDNVMLVWLGKNRLKQRENHEFLERETHVHYSNDSAAHRDEQIQTQELSKENPISSE